MDDSTSTETSVKKQKVTPLKSDDSIKTVKEVLAREREIVTRSSVLKGTKNFTHAINLARQLVLGKDVAPTGRPGATQKSGGICYHLRLEKIYLTFLCSSKWSIEP